MPNPVVPKIAKRRINMAGTANDKEIKVLGGVSGWSNNFLCLVTIGPRDSKNRSMSFVH